MARNSAVHEEIYKGYKIEIFTDEDAGNPRREWDQAGKMICFHRKYDLGDKHDFKSPRDFIESLIDDTDLGTKEMDEISDDFAFELASKHNLIFPLYLYDHSGISIRMSDGGNPFTCQWDSGQVGWIYISHENIKKEWGENEFEKAKKCLAAETETYNDYLTGNVYGYVVSKNISQPGSSEAGEDPEWEEVESCWGYYGDYQNYGREKEEPYIMQEAKSICDHLEEKDLPLLAKAGLLKGDNDGKKEEAQA